MTKKGNSKLTTKKKGKSMPARKPSRASVAKKKSKNSSFISKFKSNKKLPAILFIGLFAVVGSYLLIVSHATTILNPQTTWAACTNGGMYTPLSDSAAAALVTHQSEIRQKNATPYTIDGVSYPAANNYTPTTTEISNYQNAVNRYKQTNLVSNPYSKFVTGNSTLTNPSTDDLIQWAAHKWGIPEDWLRSQYALESNWNHFGMGDLADLSKELDYTTNSSGVTPSASTVSNWYSQEPSYAKFPYPVFPENPPYPQVYESVGITQLKWRPNNDGASGTEPIRWKSIAFNIDHQASTVRFYYDDPQGVRTSWGDTSYVRCQAWNSIGGWYAPYPWGNSGQLGYISDVQSRLNTRVWTTSAFIDKTFVYPSVVTFNSPTSDTAAPTQPTNLTSPAQTNSSINLSWTASTDNVGITGYDIYRNNIKLTTTATNSFSDTGLVPSTAYTYYVVARDAASNSSQPSNTISASTKAATAGDTTAPTVTISSPANGSTITRSVTVNATATDSVGVTKMEVWFDGVLKCPSTSSSISCGINTRKTSSGYHTITVKAYDAAGNVGQSSVAVIK